MSLKDKLQSDLLDAMRARNEIKRSVLRMLKADIQNAEIQKGKILDDAEIIEIISRDIRRRKEGLEEFRRSSREDIIAKEEAELRVVESYLPKQMSEGEVIELARRIAREIGAQGPGDKGKVMSKLMPQVKGKADGKLVSRLVDQVLCS